MTPQESKKVFVEVDADESARTRLRRDFRRIEKKRLGGFGCVITDEST